jgi:hypothetical protein
VQVFGKDDKPLDANVATDPDGTGPLEENLHISTITEMQDDTKNLGERPDFILYTPSSSIDISTTLIVEGDLESHQDIFEYLKSEQGYTVNVDNNVAGAGVEIKSTTMNSYYGNLHNLTVKDRYTAFHV